MKLLKWLDAHLEEYIAGIGLVILTCLIFGNAVARYCFNSSAAWVDEISRDVMIVTGWVSMAWWIRRNNGISVDAFVSAMPVKVRKILQVFSLIVTTAFVLICFFGSFGVVASTASSSQYSGTLRVPMQYYFCIIVFGMGLALLRCIQRWYFLFKGKDPKEVDAQ